MLDRAGVVSTWNQAAERMWGIRAEQVIHREIFSLPMPGGRPLSREPFERVWNGLSREEVSEVVYNLPGGQAVRAVLRISPLRNPTGAVLGALGTLSPVNSGSKGAGRPDSR